MGNSDQYQNLRKNRPKSKKYYKTHKKFQEIFSLISELNTVKKKNVYGKRTENNNKITLQYKQRNAQKVIDQAKETQYVTKRNNVGLLDDVFRERWMRRDILKLWEHPTVRSNQLKSKKIEKFNETLKNKTILKK